MLSSNQGPSKASVWDDDDAYQQQVVRGAKLGPVATALTAPRGASLTVETTAYSELIVHLGERGEEMIEREAGATLGRPSRLYHPTAHLVADTRQKWDGLGDGDPYLDYEPSEFDPQDPTTHVSFLFAGNAHLTFSWQEAFTDPWNPEILTVMGPPLPTPNFTYKLKIAIGFGQVRMSSRKDSSFTVSLDS